MYPKVLCNSCYIAVYRCKKSENFHNMKVHDYDKNLFVSTRGKNHQKCCLCRVAQQTLLNVPKKQNTSTFIKMCPICLPAVGRGKRHSCSQHTKLKNLSQIVGNSADHLVADVLRNRIKTKAPLVVSNVRGKPMRVKLVDCTVKKSETSFTHTDLLRMKTDLKLSTSKVS